MLFGDPRQETSPTRGSVLESLERFEQVLLRQHRRIDELDSIAATNKTDEGLRKLIAHMKEQLAEKDREIAALRRELTGQDADLGRLRRRVAAQTKELARQGDELARLGAKADRQATALARQDHELNNAYVMIATKAELKKRGVARRGKVASDGLADPSKFTKVDIRRLGEMTFKAKKARILTNMPTSAYTLAKNGDGTYTLRITDKARFWSASKFLVIQTN